MQGTVRSRNAWCKDGVRMGWCKDGMQGTGYWSVLVTDYFCSKVK
jgi:hypothetical protein